MSVMRHSLKKQHVFRPKIYYDSVTCNGNMGMVWLFYNFWFRLPVATFLSKKGVSMV